MTTPEQEARELLARISSSSLAELVEPVKALANLIEERDRLRAGIEAALVEIEEQREFHKKRESEVEGDLSKNYYTGCASGFINSADIVRKHTGVTP